MARHPSPQRDLEPAFDHKSCQRISTTLGQLGGTGRLRFMPKPSNVPEQVREMNLDHSTLAARYGAVRDAPGYSHMSSTHTHRALGWL
jgi:hypothetical protein